MIRTVENDNSREKMQNVCGDSSVGRDGVNLHMQWQEAEHFRKGTAGRLRVRISVDEPDLLFEEYRAKGVFNDDVRVRNTEWGTREFGFRDLDGNGLIF